jgi:hypothetical protein
VIPRIAKSLSGVLKVKFVISPDILKELRIDSSVWKNFQKFSLGYKRIRIGFIEAARNRPREFEKRLRYFIFMTGKNKQFGFGGIQKYY